MQSAKKFIEQLQLEPLAEGGWFKRIYESSQTDNTGRRYSAAIYYLLEAPDFSCFHRIDCDEIWHFYAGEALMIHQIDAYGKHTSALLGNPLDTQLATPSVIIPAGSWFAAEIISGEKFSLVGCTTTPEFIYPAYEIIKRNQLIALHAQHTELITRLTRH
tara:strand:- start:161 stop:640 length:480 start_codon:yes stop_codon:yes gene_type:complete